MILSSFPYCVKLTGKSGRGKTVFLRYLVFYILLEAKRRSERSTSEEISNLTNPRIAFVDRDRKLYHITKEKIILFDSYFELKASAGQPHYYFSDNIDFSDASAGSLVTMAVSSGDTEVLKEFTKRMNESHIQRKSELIMPGLELPEMLMVFSDLSAEEVAFKFDALGGNPRLIRASPSININSSFYCQVSAVVDLIFSSESQERKDWTVSVVCNVLNKAEENRASDALDSSTFRDFVVLEVTNLTVKFKEVFSSRFLGFVASRIHSATETTTKATILKLFGSAGLGVFFEYEAQLSLLDAGPEDVYNCRCQRTNKIVELCLGGGNLKLIRNIQDLRTLRDGDSGIPTVSNYPLIDKLLFREKKFGLQMTTGRSHIGSETKLQDILKALDIQNEQDFSIVFIVPRDSLERFVFPTNLGKVSLYLTTSLPSTKTVIGKNVKKHPSERDLTGKTIN